MASDMNAKVSRRDVLKVGAGVGVGAAIAGVPALVFLKDDNGHAAVSAAAKSTHTPAMTGTTPSGPIVAYVRDAASGEVVIMQGVNEVVIKDAKLVARLMGEVEG
jgi:hypothetical protein